MSKSGKLLYNWSNNIYKDKLHFDNTNQLNNTPYDIAIIGAGVVGTALAYKLSQNNLKIVLIDKNYDVGESTSKGSSAIIHTGFDAPIDTLESKLVVKAASIWPELSEKLKIPMTKCGAIVVATDDEQNKQLQKVYEKGLQNNVKDIQILSTEEVLKIEPNITTKVKGAVLVPRESIADPFATCVAYAEVAIQNGTDILLGVEITAFQNLDNEVKTLITKENQKIEAKIIVNVAGLGSESIAKLYHGEEFNTNPRRGQFLIFDKFSRSEVNHILLPIPTKKTKGVLVAPTIFGNLIAGPTAEDYPHSYKEIIETTTEQLNLLLDGASNLYPDLKKQPVIGYYSGVRSNCEQGSYWIRANDKHKGVLTVAGIRSTGFTSSPALAEHLIEILQKEMNLKLHPKTDAIDSRKDNKWPGWWKKTYDDERLVKDNPDNAKIVCYCEQATKGDIINHLNSPLQPRTLDAIKRRTRAQMGRCQGFDCMVNVAKIISEHCEIPLENITKKGPGSEISVNTTINN